MFSVTQKYWVRNKYFFVRIIFQLAPTKASFPLFKQFRLKLICRLSFQSPVKQQCPLWQPHQNRVSQVDDCSRSGQYIHKIIQSDRSPQIIDNDGSTNKSITTNNYPHRSPRHWTLCLHAMHCSVIRSAWWCHDQNKCLSRRLVPKAWKCLSTVVKILFPFLPLVSSYDVPTEVPSNRQTLFPENIL